MCLIKYDQDINPQTYVYLIFLKEARNMHWKKRQHLEQKCWSNCMFACRRTQIDPYLSACTNWSPCTSNTSMWNRPAKNDRRLGTSLECFGTRDNFPNSTSRAQAISSTLNGTTWNWKSLAEVLLNGTKEQPTEQEEILTNSIMTS